MTEIDVKVLVEPLAHVLCAQRDGHCLCADGYGLDRIRCDEAEQAARVAIDHLLPLLVGRCAEEADQEHRKFSAMGRNISAFGAKCARDAVLALIPTKGNSDE